MLSDSGPTDKTNCDGEANCPDGKLISENGRFLTPYRSSVARSV